MADLKTDGELKSDANSPALEPVCIEQDGQPPSNPALCSRPASCWYLYIIETRQGRLYTGITTDIQRRFEQHCSGRGAKFFRTDPPSRLVYRAAFADRSSASREEFRIKALTRVKKLQLISKNRQ